MDICHCSNERDDSSIRVPTLIVRPLTSYNGHDSFSSLLFANIGLWSSFLYHLFHTIYPLFILPSTLSMQKTSGARFQCCFYFIFLFFFVLLIFFPSVGFDYLVGNSSSFVLLLYLILSLSFTISVFLVCSVISSSIPCLSFFFLISDF